MARLDLARLFVAVCAGAFCFASPAAPARADSRDSHHEACTPIARVPFTASVSGRYCLAGDLTLHHQASFGARLRAPAAIKVLADDVVIDFRGHTLEDNTLGIATNALAVLGVNRRRITVRNGSLRGFFIGVAFVGTGEAHVVESMHFEKNRYAAVSLEGIRDYVIRDNVLLRTGHGNSYYTPHGLLVSGRGTISNNSIVDVFPNVFPSTRTGTEGIGVKDGEVTIDRNTLSNAAVPEGESFGIRVSRRATAVITNNTIENFRIPISYAPKSGEWTNVDNDVSAPAISEN